MEPGERITEHTLSFDDNDLLRELVGELGAHLGMVGRALGVEVVQRGSQVWLSSHADGQVHVDTAARLLQDLYSLVARGYPLHTTDVDHALRILRADPGADLLKYFSDTVFTGPGNKPIYPRTPGQRAYVHAMRRADVVFGVGPAGTGKTFLAMAMAMDALVKNRVKRVILTRPAVEAGEKLGFLPGDLTEKVDPYLRPLFDAMHRMLPEERVARLMHKRVIEVAPLAFMRGRTLSDAYVILDEAQNTTREQMRMFLTRLGDNAKMIVNGDATQIDLPRGRESGLVHALRVLGPLPHIDVVRFGPEDVVRHPLVAEIIQAYERDDEARRIAREGRDERPRAAVPEPEAAR